MQGSKGFNVHSPAAEASNAEAVWVHSLSSVLQLHSGALANKGQRLPTDLALIWPLCCPTLQL